MTDVTDEIFAGLMEGFEQVRKHAAGDPDHGLTLHVPADVDVAAIRARTGRSQPAFARSIGVPVDTLRQWERRRRRPQGPALVLLALLERNPNLVEEMLSIPALPSSAPRAVTS